MGSARTALFNWAFTRRVGGSVVLRIEDTDRERSTAESEAALLEGLSWLGVDWDEGPIRQSARGDRYAAAIETLLERGRAYRCVCTADELEQRKRAAIAAGRKWVYDGRCRDRDFGPHCGPHAVRLRLPREGRLAWNDLVFGDSGQEAREIGDVIIRRTDGTPLYNLAVVVDDLDMAITHVIRGTDHHSNTPLQIAIYDALEAVSPQFAHLPLIVGAGGKKLSKRRDPVSVQQYRELGYLPHALRNWLVRVGWSYGDQEIFSAEEICSRFDLRSVNRASARADPGKLEWLNQHYIKSLPFATLGRELLPHLEAAAGCEVELTPQLEKLVDLLRERSKTLVEMAALARFLLVEKVTPYPEKAAQKHLTKSIEPVLADLLAQFVSLSEWSEPVLESTFDSVRARHGDLPMGKIAQAVRVATTGGVISPPIYDTVAVLGKARSLERIRTALEFIHSA